VLVYRHPRSTTRRYQGVEVRYNEMGLRDDPISPKAAGEWRVVVLGDSVAFGVGVEQQKTFSPVLQRLLADELHRPVRVINSGVGSYNTVMELAWLREYGLALQPDLVLLVYVSNDVLPTQKVWPLPSVASGPTSFFSDFKTNYWKKTFLYRLIKHPKQRRKAASVLGSPGQEGWEASMQALRDLQRESRLHQFDVGVYLWSWQLDAQQEELLAAIRDAVAPVRVEDTSSWFAGKGPLRQWFNSTVDHHPNAAAHALVAERLLESLRAQHLLPGGSG
jgi:lysophospholipase L1-like esterase